MSSPKKDNKDKDKSPGRLKRRGSPASVQPPGALTPIATQESGGRDPAAEYKLKRLKMHMFMCVSYAVWAVVSILCIIFYRQNTGSDFLRFPYATFFIGAANGVMGVSEIYQEDIMYSMRALLDVLQVVVAIPCFTTEMWLKYQVAQKEVAYIHAIVGLIPTYIFIFQHYTRQDLLDLNVMLNVVSLVGVGLAFKNFFAILSAICVFIGCCFFHSREISYNLPARQIFNLLMATFTISGYKALTAT